MQTDPIGYAAGPNQYAYVEADPINNNDPLGLDLVKTTIGKICSTTSIPERPDLGSGTRCRSEYGWVNINFGNAGSRGNAGGNVGGGGGGAFQLSEIVVTGVRATGAPTVKVSNNGGGIFSTPEYAYDLALCASLASPAARGRCITSANERAVSRYRGVNVPPLIMEGRTRKPPAPNLLGPIMIMPPFLGCDMIRVGEIPPECLIT